MVNWKSDYDHFMADNVLKRSDQDIEVRANAESPEKTKQAMTMLRIMLSTVGLPINERNLLYGLDWIKTQTKSVDEIRDSHSDSERRAAQKELRRYVNKRAREDESKFMDHVGTIHVNESQPSSDTIFDSVRAHVDSVAFREQTEPSLKSPTTQADIEELAQRFAGGVQFQRPQGTSIHHFLDDLVKRNHSITEDNAVWNFFKNEFQSFVIEHNWAKAFEGVKDFDGGEIKLPFAYTCFEFRLNGVRILVFIGENSEGVIDGIIASGINKRWYINPNRVIFDGKRLYHAAGPSYDEAILEYLKLIGAQIRAVCIMLDAKVAIGERRSLGGEALQKKRAREGKAPLRDYHVVSLAKRLRGESERGDPTGIHKRLHWRRGHWRHFKTPGGEVQYFNEEGITVSKTWINWMLVGDERLGFIDKHYRL